MTDTLIAQCPHCGSELEVTQSELQQARGSVRCGSCLQRFDAESGEEHFVAPAVVDEALDTPLAGFSVKPMADAEIPVPEVKPPALLVLLAALLAVGLLAQIGADQLRPQPQITALSIARLVVRPHPSINNALRLDAIIENSSSSPQPLPLLVLEFENSFGETHIRRRFQPAEYLRGELKGHREIPARSQIQLSLEMLDPGSNALNYKAGLEFGKLTRN